MRLVYSFSLSLLLLSTSFAAADFVPDRVRPHQAADLEIIKGTFNFEGVQGARLSLNAEDGKGEPVSMTLTIDGTEPVTLPITKIEKDGCGTQIEASLPQPDNSYAVKLYDHTTAECRMYFPYPWEVTVTHVGFAGIPSVLEAGGKPENIFLTL